MKRLDNYPRLQVLLAALCFGTTGTVQSLWPPDGASAAGVGAARILVGSLLLALIGLTLSRNEGSWPGRGSAGWLALAGVGVAVYQGMFFAALDRTGVAVGTIVAIGTGPAAAGVFGWTLNRERPKRMWWPATALACTGVATMALSGGSGPVDLVGVFMAVLSGSGYALYSVIAKRLLGEGSGPAQVMASAFLIGAALLLPVLLLSGTGWLTTPRGILVALYLGAIPTALAYLLFARGLMRLSTAETATLTLAEPLAATALAITLVGERPSTLTFAGAAVVLTGLLLLGLQRQTKAPEGGLRAAER